jgi:iron complex outermembrane receptor protein
MANAPAMQLVTTNERQNQVWYQHLTDNLLISQNKFFLGELKLDVDLSYQNNNRQLKGDEPGEHFTVVNMTLQTFNYRAKITQALSEKARYVTGIQGMYQQNQNNGAPEKILPDATLNDISFYGLFQYQLSTLKLEAGLRYSYQSIDVPYQEAGTGHSHGEEEEEEEHEDEETEYLKFSGYYNNLSASAGLTWNLNEQNLFRLNLASAFRAPNLAELLQHGTHGVRIEEGNPNLTTQQNLEVDLGYHLHTVHTSLDVSLFYNNIFDYIHLAPTADTVEDGDRIYRYSQNDAYLYGGEASLHIHPHPIHWLHVVATYSYVVGMYSSGDYLPRIPANDIYFELRFEKDRWKGLRDIYLEGGADYFFAQNNPAEFESATPGYFLLNAGVGFAIQLKRNLININVKAANLLNIDYYSHLSTLQDLGIYNMGRNIMIGIQVPFNLKN